MTSKVWEWALALVALAVAVKFVIAVVLPVLPIILTGVTVGGGLRLLFGRRGRWTR